jgi:hypothetical protein
MDRVALDTAWHLVARQGFFARDDLLSSLPSLQAGRRLRGQ